MTREELVHGYYAQKGLECPSIREAGEWLATPEYLFKFGVKNKVPYISGISIASREKKLLHEEKRNQQFKTVKNV